VLADTTGHDRLAAREEDQTYPLTPTQMGMLFHSIYEQRTSVYLTQLVIGLKGSLNVDELQAAWQFAIDRHPALRTAFRWQGVEQPEQIVRKNLRIRFERLDWRGQSPDEREERLGQLLISDRNKGLDLERAPLMRLTLVQDSDDKYELLWTSHHLLMDGWSVPIVVNDVFTRYASGVQGAGGRVEGPEAESDPSFRRYVEWLGKQEQLSREEFWKCELSGFVPNALFRSDRRGLRIKGQPGENGDNEGTEGRSVDDTGFRDEEIALTEHETAELNRFGRRHRLTTGTLMEAAWALLIANLGGGGDVVFGLTTSGRPVELKGSDSIVGLFINTLPLRVRVRREEAVPAWLAGVQKAVGRLLEHEHSSLAEINHLVGATAGSDLFDSVLVFENYPVNAAQLERCGDVAVTRILSKEQTNYPVTLQITPGVETFLRLSYQCGALDYVDAKRILERVRTVLRSMTRDCDLARSAGYRIGNLASLTEAEAHCLIYEWPERNTLLSEPSIHEAVLQQAIVRPDRVAVVCEDVSLSYEELAEQSARLANHLRRLGAGPEKRIGIYVERSCEMIIGLLGILRAGAVYVPLDPAYPRGRLEFILSNAAIDVLVTEQSLEANLEFSGQKVVLDSDDCHLWCESSESYVEPPLEGSAAYVIYTSGSTGIPKGVVVSHLNVTRLFSASRIEFAFTDTDVWSLFHSYAFDFSVWEIWGSLSHGARLVIAPYWLTRSTDAFHELIAAERVTVLNQTPSAFNQFMRLDLQVQRQRSALRLIIFGGEAIDPRTLKPWFNRYGCSAPRVVNMYGITETTVHV
ncbi:MAG: non-ribosomal peptide synthetase, partial [Blastocatellia bacterium]